MDDQPDADPLTAFISRSLRADVSNVREETVRDDDAAQLTRVTFTLDRMRRSLVVKRVPKDRALEVTLLPHLARKTDRVPSVYARGIPPAAVAGRPWLLIEDLLDRSPATDLDAIVEAKVAVERAVAEDGPALIALGVPRVDRPGVLADWPEVLLHGALGGPTAVIAGRGVVLTDWGDASLGPGLVDIVRLAHRAGAPSWALAEAYAAMTERNLSGEGLAIAEEVVRRSAWAVN